jgi:cell division protein FtsQ
MTENETVEILPEESVAGPQAPPPARRAAHPGRRRRILLAGVAGLGLVYWVGWQSPLTLVEHVVVDAPRGLSAESIRLASGISAVDRVPSVDAEAVRLGIMTSIPAVADVRLDRSLPDTIRLAVTARTPLAAVEAGKGFYVMDSQGVVYDKVARAKDLPVIRARTDADREVARGVLLAIPEDLRAKVTRITAKSRDNVTLGLRGGATVRWGGVEDSDLKARVLAGLTAVKATRYDVSAPLLPTTSGSPTDVSSPTG